MTPSTLTSASTAELTAQARLSADRSQAVFRGLLDALSRPGLVVGPPADAPTDVPAALLGVLALADVDLTVAILAADDAIGWSAVVRTATGARPAPLEQADMVVALRAPSPGEVGVVERGDPTAPERGARLFLACDSLVGSDRGDVALRLEGPGVPASRRLIVAGLPAAVFAAIADANRGFPAGIDTWLVAADGAVAGLPRSTRITVEEVG